MPTHYDGLRAVTELSQQELVNRIKSIWQSLQPNEKKVLSYLLKTNGEEALGIIQELESKHYWMKPLTIEEFVQSTEVAGPSIVSLYPKIKEDLITMVRGGYVEIVLTGGIGWGKTWSANYGLMYYLHRIMCMKNPQESLGLAGNSTLIMAMLSVNRDHAQKTILRDFGTFIGQSDFFKSVGYKITTKSIRVGKGVLEVWPSAANNNSLIGTNVVMGLVDEVNFGMNAKLVKSTGSLEEGGAFRTEAERVYSSLVTRMKSRFLDKGILPGVFYVVSSKNTLNDFTNKRIEAAQTDSSIFVADYPEWATKPKKLKGDKSFKVFFGGKTSPSRILSEGEEAPETHDEFAKVVEIPMDYIQEFKRDVVLALRDIAGVSVPPQSLYFTNRVPLIKAAKGRNESVIGRGEWIWTCVQNEVPFNWSIMTKRHQVQIDTKVSAFEGPIIQPETPRHIHVDLSTTECLTGFTMAHVHRYVEVPYKDGATGQMRVVRKPLFYVDAVFGVKAPYGGEVHLPTIVVMIEALRARGFLIDHVSSDQWQSKYMLQLLNGLGVKTSHVSMDTSTAPYDALKDAYLEGRISCPLPNILKNELWSLTRDNVADKVMKGHGASKDVADSLAGCIYTLSMSPPADVFDGMDFSDMVSPAVNASRVENEPMSSGSDVQRLHVSAQEDASSKGFFHDL